MDEVPAERSGLPGGLVIDAFPSPGLRRAPDALAWASLRVARGAHIAGMARRAEFLDPATSIFPHAAPDAAVAADRHIVIGRQRHGAIDVMGRQRSIVRRPT